MRKIWKYGFEITDSFTIEMPAQSRVLCVQIQNSNPFIWVEVKPNLPIKKYRFILVGTGHEINQSGLMYIGTFQLDSRLVFHLYQDIGDGII